MEPSGLISQRLGKAYLTREVLGSLRRSSWKLRRALAAALASLALAGCTLPTGSDGSGYHGPSSPAVNPKASPAPAAEPAAVPAPSELQVSQSVWNPARFAVRLDTPLVLPLVNRDPTQHNFTLESMGMSENLAPGSRVELSFPAFPEGIHRFYCKYHRAEMQGWITVR